MHSFSRTSNAAKMLPAHSNINMKLTSEARDKRYEKKQEHFCHETDELCKRTLRSLHLLSPISVEQLVPAQEKIARFHSICPIASMTLHRLQSAPSVRCPQASGKPKKNPTVVSRFIAFWFGVFECQERPLLLRCWLAVCISLPSSSRSHQIQKQQTHCQCQWFGHSNKRLHERIHDECSCMEGTDSRRRRR